MLTIAVFVLGRCITRGFAVTVAIESFLCKNQGRAMQRSRASDRMSNRVSPASIVNSHHFTIGLPLLLKEWKDGRLLSFDSMVLCKCMYAPGLGLELNKPVTKRHL